MNELIPIYLGMNPIDVVHRFKIDPTSGFGPLITQIPSNIHDAVFVLENGSMSVKFKRNLLGNRLVNISSGSIDLLWLMGPRIPLLGGYSLGSAGSFSVRINVPGWLDWRLLD